MKFLTSIFTILLIFSCNENYQEKPANLNATEPNIQEIREEVTTDKNFYENMQIFLDNYVTYREDIPQDTLVDYQYLYETRNDQGTEAYELRQNILTQIAKADYKNFNKEEKVAFLINAYNFLAIETVVKNYIYRGRRISTITKIDFIPFTAFSKYFYTVAGERKSLDGIEKFTLKPLLTFGDSNLVDARYHFAVNCAALGCPALQKEVFTPDNIYEQLDKATKEALQMKKNIDTSDGNLKLSSLIADWYRSEFINHSTDGESKAGSIQNFIKQYAPSIDVSGRIIDGGYDWKLNRLK